jgi:hypothetical protein
MMNMTMIVCEGIKVAAEVTRLHSLGVPGRRSSKNQSLLTSAATKVLK